MFKASHELRKATGQIGKRIRNKIRKVGKWMKKYHYTTALPQFRDNHQVRKCYGFCMTRLLSNVKNNRVADTSARRCVNGGKLLVKNKKFD